MAPPGSTSMSGLPRTAHSANTTDDEQRRRRRRAPVAAGARQATNKVPATSIANTIIAASAWKLVEHDQRRAEQIGGERAGRDRLDLAFLGGRAEQESADHQQRGEDKPGDDVE